MNNGLGFQLANVPTITGLASVQANNVTTDTIEVNTLTIDGVDIETTLNDKVSKTLNNTVTGINTFSNPLNVFYGDGSNLTGVPAPANMVTTNTVQTITAEKTFNTDIYVATNMRVGHGWNNVISNICFSTGSLEFAVSGENIAMGFGALNIHNGPNGNNVAIGSYTLSQGTNPYNNVAIGRSALFKATAGAYNNVCIGADTASNLTTGHGNFVLGASMSSLTTGSLNIAMGENSLLYVSTANYNIGIGAGAGLGTTRAAGLYIGANAGCLGKLADNVCAIGYNALYNNNVSGLAGQGHNATAIGYNAGGTNQKVGVNNTFIGSGTDIDTLGNWNNSTAIGYQATITASNQIRLGRASETVSCPGNLDVTGTITNSNLTFLSGTQTITGAKTMNNPANVLYGDGSNLTGVVSSQVTLSNTASGATNYLVMSQTNSGTSSLLTDNAGATYDSTTNTADISITGTAGIASQVTLSNTASGATNYLVMSQTNSGASSLLTDNAGATYDSTTNIASINITGNCNGTAGSINVTSTDLATIYYPLMSPGSAGGKLVFFDNSTTPLSYQPSTSTLSASVYNIPTTVTSTISATGTTINITNNNIGGSIIHTIATSGLPLNILQLNETNSYCRANLLISKGTGTSSTPTLTIEETATPQGFKIITNTTAGAYNSITQVNDAIIVGFGAAASTKNLTITSHSATTNGVRITPTTALIGAGGAAATPSSYASFSATGVSVAGATNFISPNITINSTNNFNVGNGAGGLSNTCIGTGTPRTIAFTTGNNTFIGSQAGQNMGIAADGNCFVGTSSGLGQTTGQQNTFLGAQSGNQVSGTGWRNTAIGYQALDSMITIAEDNTAVGMLAGGAVSTGFRNTCIGSGAGGNITTGSDNVCIGAYASPTTATAVNQIILGTAAETMYIRGGFNWRVGTQITASISFVGIVMAQFYTVAMTAASQTITLPNPTTAAYLGATVTFKRKTNTTAFNFAAAGTTPFLGTNSITPVASPTTIGTTTFQVDMVCDGTNWCFISLA